VYMDVLMSRSARMRVSDAAAILRDSTDLVLVMRLWDSSDGHPVFENVIFMRMESLMNKTKNKFLVYLISS